MTTMLETYLPQTTQKTTSRKRVLIIAPPYRLSQTSFPLGVMYIASALQSAGHLVEAIDMDVLNLSEADYARELRDRQYDYFCIGGMITAWNFILFSCNLVKQIKPHVRVIVGGGIISSTPESLLSVSNADVGCIGDGEETILELIEALENDEDLDTVAGIVYKQDGRVVETKSRELLKNPDKVPFPAWDLFHVDKNYCNYPSHSDIFKAKRTASIYTQRGCPFRCSFCYTEKTMRYRSIGNVIAEIQELMGRYHVGYINIQDDLFAVNKKRVVEFCEALIKNKIRVQWSAGGRCNIIDKEFLKICKAAGCDFMGLGIESGSDTMLKRMHKSQTPEQIVNAVKMCSEVGITPGGTFILGLPGENRQTIRETVEIYKTINRYRRHVNHFFFAAPYPGTELYREMKAAGKIGDEIKFFERASEKGDAVDFLANCTYDLTDEELKQIKKEVEKEVFDDFKKKHPGYAMMQWFTYETPWSKVLNLLLMFKMQGFVRGMQFLVKKILIYLKLAPNVYQRRWNFKRAYEDHRSLTSD